MPARTALTAHQHRRGAAGQPPDVMQQGPRSRVFGHEAAQDRGRSRVYFFRVRDRAVAAFFKGRDTRFFFAKSDGVRRLADFQSRSRS